MFISHFNRYFEKHAKVTYLVLLIVIIATFVIFVTPGDVFRGDGRVSDLGEMYGKKLNVEQMRTEFQKTTVGLWLQYPQYFGRDLGLGNDMLLQQTLTRMRLLHAAKSLGLAKVSDQEVKDAIAKCPVFFENGKFSPDAFKTALDGLKNGYGMLASEFDDVIRENIIIERVQNKVVEDVAVSDDELDAVLAQYSLKCATIPVNATAADPTEEDIQNFFATRKSEIKLPETKNALVALFKFDELKAKVATDAALAAKVTPTQEEIQRYFDTNGARLFSGKQLSEVTAEITNTLLDEKVRAEARRRALELSRAFATATENEDAAQRSARFQEEAQKAGASVGSSGLVSTENTISGLPGAQPNLANAIRNLANVGDVTGLVMGTNYTAVAYVTEKQATVMPVELPALSDGASNDFLRTTIRQMILREKALAFFQAQVKEPYEAYVAKVKAIEEDKSASDAVKQQQIMALNDTIDSQLVVKFFVPESRDFVLATFAPEAYRDRVAELTEDDLRKAYEERKATYQKVKVRLGRIFIETDGLEGDALTAKEAKLAEVQQKLAAEGADFLALAKEYSEQSSQEDRSLRDLDSLPEAQRAAVANLQAGQVSPVVKDARGSYLLKVLERQDGRAFAEVQAELKEELTADAAKRLADEDAAKFALAASDQWWAASEKAEGAAVEPATLFEEQLQGFPAAKLDSFTNVSPYDSSYAPELLYKVFTVQEKAPITSNIVTASASYVAALVGHTEEHLSDPSSDAQAYAVLVSAYRDAVQMEQALRTAQSERARLSAALVGDKQLSDVAEGLKFDDLPAFSQNDLSSRAPVVSTIENGKQIAIGDLAAQLANAQAGMVLEPIRAERRFNSPQSASPLQQVVVPMGYQLIYVAGIDKSAAQAVSAETRDALRERLLATKKNQALNDYMAQLEAQSNTKLRGE